MTPRHLVHVNKLFTSKLKVELQRSSATFLAIYQTELHLQSKWFRVFQNNVLARNQGHKNRKYQEYVQKFRNLQYSPNIIRVKRIRWTGYVARVTEGTNTWSGISENKR